MQEVTGSGFFFFFDGISTMSSFLIESYLYICVYIYTGDTTIVGWFLFSSLLLFVFFRKTIRKWKFFFYYCKKFSFSVGRVFKIEVDNRNPNVFPLNVFDHIWLGNRITLIFDAIVVVTMWQWTNKGGYKEEERMNTMRQRCLCVSI